MIETNICANGNKLTERLNKFCRDKNLVLIKEKLHPIEYASKIMEHVTYKNKAEKSYRIFYDFGGDTKGHIKINEDLSLKSNFFYNGLGEMVEINKLDEYLVNLIRSCLCAKSFYGMLEPLYEGGFETGQGDIDHAINQLFNASEFEYWMFDDGMKLAMSDFIEEIDLFKKKEEDLVNELAKFLSE